MKIKASLALIAASAMLTACVSSPSPRPLPPPVQPQGVEGTWADPNGILSTFQAGQFNTRSTDNNALLATGTYVNTSPTLVEISMTSILRQKQSKVNCALVTPAQLNCTSDAGSQFTLTRRM
ncbi:outer membrane lipoprotein Omp10 [Rhizobium oryzicola]|uniref:Outer membrane lipoprotein Omp10 n=1 Tax=Rhizobium oryzicola TaxID=1232668 RepID=A0ABT8SVA1_9HYPH|nr:outer membrane lipoprotein Omp10 [Rhizobium oryzicola]MDO1581988.1 outer membrane lipoprotein Omp10 [Rhizobium oryzicola]